MAVSLLTQHCSKSLKEDCGNSSHTLVDCWGGGKKLYFSDSQVIYVLALAHARYRYTTHTHKENASYYDSDRKETISVHFEQ